MKRTLATLFILLPFSFLGDSVLRAMPETTIQGQSVPITPLDPKRSAPGRSFVYVSGIEDPLRVVIRDRDAWREIWKRINAPNGELPSLPVIDFSLEMIVVVALGTRPTSGYGIIVDRAHELDDQLEIVVHSVSPKQCGVFPMMTTPVDIVRLPMSKRPVVFRETEVVNKCN